jgi:hypothetical protein
LLIRLFHGQLFASNAGAVQGLDRTLGFRVISHVYEAEAFAFPGLPVNDNFSGVNYTIQFKHFFKINIVEIRR